MRICIPRHLCHFFFGAHLVVGVVHVNLAVWTWWWGRVLGKGATAVGGSCAIEEVGDWDSGFGAGGRVQGGGGGNAVLILLGSVV